MRNFVFLICSERSGSNFITSLLNGHSLVSGPSPTHLFRLFGSNIDNYGDLTKEENWNILLEDFLLNFGCKLGIWHTNITLEELRQKARSRNVAELLRIVYEKEAEYDKASHIFVKENHTYRFAPFLLDHFPECKFVFMVRDPRDVASSWVSTESIPGGVEKAVDTWMVDQSGGLALDQRLRGTDRLLLVRYEDLISDAEQCLQHITSFLGLTYEPQMLEFYQHPRTRMNAEAIHAWANLSKPVVSGNAGKFRKTLSPEDVRYVELQCFDLMKSLGYEPEQVREKPEARDLEQEISALRPVINEGSYIIRGDEEQETRRRRRTAIDCVLERRL